MTGGDVMVEFGESVGYHNRSPDEEDRSKKELSRSSLRSYRSFECSPFRSIDRNERSWNEKVAEISSKKRFISIKQTINIVLLAASFIFTLVEQPVEIQIFSYLSTLSFFFAADPISAMDIFLAPQTRRILSVVCIMIAVAIIKCERNILIVVTIITLLGLFFIKKLNTSWLAHYNWVLSDEVEKVLMIDSEHASVLSWQADGKRKTRTLLYKLGLDIGSCDQSEEILDVLHKPVYLCGYLCGMKKDIDYKKKTDMLSQAREELNEFKEKYNNLEHAYNKILKQIEDEKNEFLDLIRTANEWQQMYKEELERNKVLLEANKELLESLPNEELVERSEENKAVYGIDDKIIDLRESKGLSYGKIAEILGCSKTKVSNVITKWKNDITN